MTRLKSSKRINEQAVFLTLKCGENDSAFFIQQLSEQNDIDRVIVFRDYKSRSLKKVTYIERAANFLGPINFLLRVLQMWKLRKLNPVILAGIYEIPHGLIVVIFALITKKPSVVSVIGNPAYTKLRRGFRMQLTMWILRKASYITVTGSRSKNYLITKGLPENKIWILPNTMDFNGFNRPKAKDKKYEIISLGRLSEEKRVGQIILVIAELKKNFPDLKAAIGGTGPEKGKLQQLSNDLGLNDTIDFLGFVPDDELPGFLGSGRVFILTSETEGFPRTIIQAASCGAAIVASKVGDITDVIDHEKNGFLVERWDDTMSFVKYTKTLLENMNITEQFIEKLDAKVRIQFDNAHAMKVWKDIITESKSTI
jgi:glycosyltransferase involved in cell wall biosynthesis